MRAYVSLSFADTDDAPLTAYVTFCTPLPDVRSYIPGLESVEGAAVGGEFCVDDGGAADAVAGLDRP